MLYANLIGRIAFFTGENIAHIEFYLQGLLPKILAINTIKKCSILLWNIAIILNLCPSVLKLALVEYATNVVNSKLKYESFIAVAVVHVLGTTQNL